MYGLDWHQFKPIKIVILSRALRIRRESAWSFTCLSKISYPLAFDLLLQRLFIMFMLCEGGVRWIQIQTLHMHISDVRPDIFYSFCFLSKQDCYGAKYILWVSRLKSARSLEYFNYPGSEPGFSFRLSFLFFFFSACLRHITEVVVVKSY